MSDAVVARCTEHRAKGWEALVHVHFAGGEWLHVRGHRDGTYSASRAVVLGVIPIDVNVGEAKLRATIAGVGKAPRVRAVTSLVP